MDITVTEIMELADMRAHAKITDGTPAELLPRNLLQCRMQQIVSHVFGQDCELTAARQEIESLQGRVNECGAGAGCCAQAARIAELEAQLEAVATPAQPLHVAATSCPHEIDKDKIVLHFDSKQPGKNALAQLAARLQAAHAQEYAKGAERYRLLNLGVDVIQADDEFLSNDTATWATDPNGVFVGLPYQGYALLPARRKLNDAIAAQQGAANG